MIIRYMLNICFLSLLAVSVVGCHKAVKRPSGYAERAFLDQQVKRQHHASEPHYDEVRSSEITLEDDEDEGILERKAYESVDAWKRRVYDTLEMNKDSLSIAREELETINKEEKDVIKRINVLLHYNKKLQEAIENPSSGQDSDKFREEVLTSLPFFIHLVEKGETLYSLSHNYYDSGRYAKDIALWNQGWVRHPDDILAGLGVVIFPNVAKEKDASVVERYIKTLRVQDVEE
jgi:hypothetical protein